MVRGCLPSPLKIQTDSAVRGFLDPLFENSDGPNRRFVNTCIPFKDRLSRSWISGSPLSKFGSIRRFLDTCIHLLKFRPIQPSVDSWIPFKNSDRFSGPLILACPFKNLDQSSRPWISGSSLSKFRPTKRSVDFWISSFKIWTDSAVLRYLHPLSKIQTDSAVRGFLDPLVQDLDRFGGP